MRSERWNTVDEITQQFRETGIPCHGAGPILYAANGRKYSDDGESHIAVIGRTGKGKSQCCSLPYMREILQKKESLIMLDPKGEGYEKNACFIPPDYQIFCVDFRTPRKSPTKWNPISMPYRLFSSGDPDESDTASSLLSEFWNGVYPYDGHSDRFWTDSAANYAKGLTYALFQMAPKEHVNLDSVAIMMEQSEIRMGTGTLLKAFYDDLPGDSLAKRNLAAYVTAPNETRASIHSVAASGLEVFSRSKGLMEMLADDTLNILDIDVCRPFCLVIITPDETDVYDALAGLLVSQISQHLIRVAQEKRGKLPIRVNLILEELGSVGRSIPSLPNLMVASRSRNIRLMLVLQSNTQLVDVYGKSKAETILSCIGITIGFSTNSWETLLEWEHRCGKRQINNNGRFLSEPLITASQLAAMPTGTALVMAESQYKFISRLPFYYDEMYYDNSDRIFSQPLAAIPGKPLQSFDFEKMVKDGKKKKIEEMMNTRVSPKKEPEPPAFSSSMDRPTGKCTDIDSLVARIDARLAELEEERKHETRYQVVVTAGSGNRRKVAQIIAAVTGEQSKAVTEKLERVSVAVDFSSEQEAVQFARKITIAGGNATVKST